MSQLFWLSVLLCLIAGAAIDTTNVCLVRATSHLTQGKPAMAVGILVITAGAAIVFFVNSTLALHHRPIEWAYPNLATVAGAAMFALGSVLNDACAIGTIGRIARGDFGHVATFAGAAAAAWLLPCMAIVGEPAGLPALTGVNWLFVVLGVTAVIVVLGRLHVRLSGLAAYLVLGVVSGFVTDWQGNWTWLGVAQHLQAGLQIQPAAFLLIGAVLLGAAIAAYWRGHFQWVRPNPLLMLWEFIGGGLMAGGAILLPGANDALSVYGVPSGSPNAVAGYALMFVLMMVMLRMKRLLRPPGRRLYPAPLG